MILHFKARTHIYTDKQHLEIKQASMIVQEKEPLSAVSVVTNEVTALFFYGYTTLPKSLSPTIRLRSLHQISQTSAGSAYPHEGVSRETESPTATKPLA